MAESIHKDHRKRMKKRFLEQGLDGFSDFQALEFLLFYGVPQGDTNALAHELIAHFGSLSQVLDAPAEELMRVSGIGEHSAILLRLINDMGRFYLVDKARQERVLPTIADCARFLLPYFHGRRLETVFLLCLDAKCMVISCREIGEGGVNSAGLSVRRVVETALREGASSVVLAHNHPSGIAIPSPEDIQATRRTALALQAVDICLVDHLVIADGDYVSMAQSGYRFDEPLLV